MSQKFITSYTARKKNSLVKSLFVLPSTASGLLFYLVSHDRKKVISPKIPQARLHSATTLIVIQSEMVHSKNLGHSSGFIYELWRLIKKNIADFHEYRTEENLHFCQLTLFHLCFRLSGLTLRSFLLVSV